MKLKAFFLFFILTSPAWAIQIDLKTALELYQKGQDKEAYLVFFQLQEKEASPEAYFYLGNLAARMDKNQEAEVWYQKGVVLPAARKENFFFNLGALALKNGKWTEAVFYFEKLSVKSPVIRLILNALYYRLKDYSKAETQIKTLIQENHVIPDEFLLSIYENYFFTFLKQDKIYSAIPVGGIIRNFPDRSIDFWENYGGLLLKTSQISKAQEVFVQLLNTPGSKRENYEKKLLALTLFFKNQPQEAALYADQFLKDKPARPDLTKLAAYAYHLSGQKEKAWNQIKTLNPSTREDYEIMGLLAYEAGFMNEAIQILEAGFLIHSHEPRLLAALVSIYVREKKYRQMEFVVEFYQQKNKTDRFTLWLFQLALTEEKIDRALELGEKILASDEPKDHAFYYNLGKVYEKKSRFDLSEKYYLQSKTMAPDFPYPYAALAGLYTASSRYEPAADHYLVLIKLIPDYGVYYYQLAQVYSLSESYFLAKEFFKQAVFKGFPRETVLEDPLCEPVKKRFPEFVKELENS